jgi:hypothetical protein
MSGLDNTSETVKTVVAAASPYSVTLNDYDVIVNSASAFSIVLPAPPMPGRLYRIYNAGAGTTTVTATSGTIDGGASTTLAGTPHAKAFLTDGTNWFTVSSY